MDQYDDSPNPFSNDPSPPPSTRGLSSINPSRTPSPPPLQDLSITTPSSADKPLPPNPQAQGNAYPNVNPYSGTAFHSSSSNNNNNISSPFPSKPRPGSTTDYPNINPYPIPTHNQTTTTPSKTNSVISAASGSPPPTFRPSFPNPGAGMKSYIGPKVKEEACCGIDEELQNGTEISIIDAVKTNDGGRASYITYVIKTGNHETHHRYTHFDSLRSSLQSLYPVLIVPPIPDKQSLADYAVKGSSKAKEDAAVIGRRMRVLEDFLRRLGGHPILGGEHVLHRFLEGGVSWNEVLHSPPLSLLPKNPLHAPTYNPTLRPAQPFANSPSSDSQPLSSETTDDLPSAQEPDSASTATTPYIAHHLLPTPSAATPLKHPDARFMDSEAFTDKFANHLSGVMERVNRRVVKRWGERAHGASELGAVINGFSLDLDASGPGIGGGLGGGTGVGQGEEGNADEEARELGIKKEGKGMEKVQEATEKFGQAIDAEHLSTALLLQQWERHTTEPLHIYAQYGQIIRARLSFRHQKHVQYELVQATLDHQREKLELLEKAEAEARRLDEALESGGKNLINSSSGSPQQGGGTGGRSGLGQSVLSGQSVLGGGSVYRDPRASTESEGGSGVGVERGTPTTPKKRGGGGGYGFLSAVKHSLSGMMDHDPEATRRANIGKTRDNISQLEDSLQASAQDLKYASQTLQADLDRFQRQKVADLRDLAIHLAEIHRDWAKTNLKAWEEAKLAVEGIDPHPNQPPQSRSTSQPQPTINVSSDANESDGVRSFSVDRPRGEVSGFPGSGSGSGRGTFEIGSEDDGPAAGPVKDHPL